MNMKRKKKIKEKLWEEVKSSQLDYLNFLKTKGQSSFYEVSYKYKLTQIT
jgi:hypothetical protein